MRRYSSGSPMRGAGHPPHPARRLPGGRLFVPFGWTARIGDPIGAMVCGCPARGPHTRLAALSCGLCPARGQQQRSRPRQCAVGTVLAHPDPDSRTDRPRPGSAPTPEATRLRPRRARTGGEAEPEGRKENRAGKSAREPRSPRADNPPPGTAAGGPIQRPDTSNSRTTPQAPGRGTRCGVPSDDLTATEHACNSSTTGPAPAHAAAPSSETLIE